jgi:hypothetical protein
MPSTSAKQHNFMAAVANNPAFAKKAGVPQSVGKEFTSADKGIKFKGGPRARPDLQKVNKPKTLQGKTELFKKGGEMKESKAMVKKEVSFMKAKGAPKSMIKHEAAEMGGMKKGGAAKKMASGGLSGGHKAADGVASKGKTKGMQVSMPGNKGLKKGGMAKKYC